MHALILFLMLLYPAPRAPAEPPPPDSTPLIVGSWNGTWGDSPWDPTFKADGTYSSKFCGKGIWWIEDDLVYFTDNGVRWVIQIKDYHRMDADGGRALEQGICDWVDVTLTRRRKR